MIEPGLLSVFRLYALLRVVLAAAALARQSLISPSSEQFFQTDQTVSALFLSLILLLALYLSSDRLRHRMGRAYLPVALLVASLSLFGEQFRYSALSFWGQPDSYFFILLILVGWQYRFSGVLVFVLGVTGLDILLNQLYQPVIISAFSEDAFRGGPIEESSRISGTLGITLVYGRMLARALSLLFVGFVVTRLVGAQREQRQELAQANLQLRQHAATLEQLATSRERNRLSRELHDTVAHTLSGLSVQIEALQATWQDMPGKAAALVDTMLSETRQGLEETRRTLQNLRASPLEELGLALALNNLAEDVGRRNNLEMQIDILDENLDVDSEVEHSFYRVAQEGLENVVRHAVAKQVTFALKQVQGRLQLIIEDDGLGFNPTQAAHREHLGLELMRERADLIGARFEINSKPDRGTRLLMEL